MWHLFSITGCSAIKATNANIQILSKQIETLNLELDSLKELYTQQHRLLRHIKSNQQMQLSDIERKITVAIDGISENQLKQSKTNSKNQKMKDGLKNKLNADSLSKAKRTAEAEILFDVALEDFNTGRESFAITGFRDVINIYPDIPTKVEESLYWIAECLFHENKYTDAEITYNEYIKKYESNGTLICPSLYKLGLIYESQNKKDQAEKVWNKLRSKCQDSQEVMLLNARSINGN